MMLAGVGVLLKVAPHTTPAPEKRGAAEEAARAPELAVSFPAQPSTSDSLRADAGTHPGPWRATRRYFACSAPNPAPPERTAKPPQNTAASAHEQQATAETRVTRDVFCLPNDYAYEVLIATVPDPRRSRLGLFTDRVLENIQRGAAKAGWEYDSQWLPWQDAPDPDEKDPERRMKERAAVAQERREPGVLLFRHQPVQHDTGLRFDRRLLLVFIVGETPTSGINKGQFLRAHEYTRRILRLSTQQATASANPELPIRLLAPTFSGSFSSLAELVQSSPASYEIISGTATGKRYADAFLATVHQPARVRFASARVYDEDLDHAFRLVLRKLKISTSDAVSLVEDESGYGNSQSYVPNAGIPDDKTKELRVRTILFPRDISQLRNAYREAVQEAKQKDASNQSPLPFTLKDNKEAEDSLPLYAEVHTAESQNAALQELIMYLRRSRVRLARIAATNPLDMLFLVRVLHEQFPDLRVLLTTADLLLVQQSDIQHITGTLALAPNPPILTPVGRNKAPISVEVDTTSTGVFEAVWALLRTDAPPELNSTKPVSLNNRIWLMEATRNGFAPLAIFPTEANITVTSPSVAYLMPLPSRFWFVSMNILSFIALGLSLTTLYSYYARRQPHAKPVPFWLDYFALQPSYAANPGRAFFLAGLYVCTAAMLILELQPAIASQFSGTGTSYVHVVEGVAFTAFLCLSLALVSVFVRFLEMLCSRGLTPEQKLYGVYWMLLISAAIAVEIVWGHCCHSNIYFAQSYLFRFRALQLYPSASPTIPFLLVLIGVASVFFFQLRRVVWHEQASACFPIAPLDDLPGSNLQDLYQHLCRRLFSLGITGENIRWSIATLAAGFTSLALFMYFLGPAACLHTAEPASYDVMYLLLQGVFIVLLVITCSRGFMIWRTLRSILIRLHYLPLADVFSRFQQTGGSRYVWSQTLKLPALDTVAVSTPRIHDLKLLPRVELAEYPLGTGMDAIWTEYETARKEFLSTKSGFCNQAVRKMRTATERTAEALTRGIVMPHWESAGYLASANGKNGGHEPATDKDRAYELAVEFVVLQYISFIRYALRQLRNLAWLLSVSFLFIALSLTSYSFQSPQLISRFIIGLFVAVGTAVTIVFAQMERDAILSRLSGSPAGELSKDFVLHVVRYGALPVLGLLASLFPAVATFLFSWVGPSIERLQ
jgi:hypothetical protein